MSKEIEDMMRFCKNQKLLICYGAGQYGKTVWRFLKKNKIKVDLFVVSDGENKNIQGINIPVKFLSEINEEIHDAAFLVCVCSAYKKDVLKNLKQMGAVHYYSITNTILKRIYDLEFIPAILKNKCLKGSAEKQRCFILCNGPSVKTQNLSKLKNEIVFSCSLAYLLPEYHSFNPKYYVSPALTYNASEENIVYEYLKMMDEKITSSCIFLDVRFQYFVDRYKWINKKEIFYLYQGAKWKEHREKIYDISKNSPEIQTVPIMMLKIAMYMGFKEIYLVGTEHDFLIKKEYKHAYEGSGDLLSSRSLEDEKTIDLNKLRVTLRQATNVFEEYYWLHCIAKKNNIKIFNATCGGILDEFERVNFDDIIK